MNQTHTTNPTEGCVDQGSRAPASRHGLGALSGVFLRGLLGRVAVSIGALVMIGLMVAPAQAQLDDVECSNNYSVSGYGEESAQKAAEADCLNIVVTLPNGSQHQPANQAEKPGPLWELEIRFVKGPSPFFDGYTGYWVDKTPEVDPIKVQEDLLSFARWKTDEGGDSESNTALYTLTTGAGACQTFDGNGGAHLRFENQLSTAVCQIGEVTGKETNSVWDRTVKLKWRTPEACKANTVLFFGVEPAKRNTEDSECDLTQLRNYEIPDKATLAGQANGGKVAVKLGMDISNGNGGSDSSQDLIIGYWTPAASSAPDCSDESIDWTTAATEDGWSCTVDGAEYEYADFHVIKKMAAHKDKTCESFAGVEGVEGEMREIKACASTVGGNDAYFIVLGTWSNNKNARFSWVDGFTQFGLNFKTGKRNQVGDMPRAFYQMGGDGGPAMEDLDTSNITTAKMWFNQAKKFNRDISGWTTSNMTTMEYMFGTALAFNQNLSGWDVSKVTTMEAMFLYADAFNQDLSGWEVSQVTNMALMFGGAKAFNQDLSGWDVSQVTNHSSFDQDATAWCGLGFDNRGRPGGWDPSAADGCLNLEIQAPDTALAGTEVQFVLQYSNATDAEFTGGMTFTVPDGMTITASTGTLEGKTLTWSDLPVSSVPAEQLVTVKIDDGVQGGELLTSATLSDGGTFSVNDTQTVTVTQLAMLSTEITATRNVVPGDVIDYTVSVDNSGLADTQGGEVTLTWDSDVPLTIVKGGLKCRSTSNCVFPIYVPAEGRATQRLQVRVGTEALAGGLITVNASANATNEAESSESNASASTEIASLPPPELKVDVTTQPQGVVDVGAQFTALVDLSNTGSGPAVSTTVTLDIGSATYVGAAVGNAPSYADNVVTWTVDNLDTAQGEVLSVRLQAPQAEGAVILKSEVSTTEAGNVITDSASVSLSVTGTAVLDLQLSLNPEDQLLPGDVLDMDFGFQNIGNSPAAEVLLATDTPVDTTLLAWPDYATCAGNDCSEGYTGPISLNLGTVPAKENAVTSLSVLVNETAKEQTLSVWGRLNGKNTAGDALPTQAAAESVRVAASTDDVLTVNQRADRQTVAPGQVVVYEITYQNLSNEAVTNATLTDVLPKDTRLLNQTGGTVTIDPETQETTWQLTPIELAPLAKGTALLQVEVAGNAEAGTSLNNTVSLSTADSTVWANNAEVTVVANGAVLESSISNPEATAPGDSFTYALRFANTGTLAAANTTLQMQVENVVSVTDCDGCSESADGRLSWSLGSIAKGTDQTKQITVQVDPDVAANSELYAISYISDSQSAGAVGAGAQLTAQQQRRRGGSASANQATSAAERAGPLGLSTIRVGEKASPALGGLRMIVPEQVVAGDQVAVTVTFGNTGGAPATGVTLTSRVPANSTLSSIEGGSCSSDPCIAGGTLTWNVGEVAAASTREVSYSLTSDSASAGSVIGHQVALDSAESREESASANTDIVAEKLSVSIAVTDAAGNDAEGSIVGVGDKLTYTLTLLNNSPTARSGITVVNQVPRAIAACGQACIGGDSGGAAIDAEAGTLMWSNFDLDAGAEVALDYRVTIPSGLENNTKLINNVSVNTAARFSDSALSTVTVATQAELALSMTAPDVLQDGAQGAVTMSYKNTGTRATAATLRYVLPSNATMIDSANATISGSTYTWTLGDVAVGSGGGREITIEARGAADSTLLHTASVTGTDAGDTAEATTVIGLREELALSLTAPGSVNTGDGFIASLTARNTGNAAATATALSLTLPAGFTVSALDGGTLDNQVVRWNVDLAAGASVTRSPTLKAPAAAGNAVLLASLSAASGKTQSASAAVQVTMAASAIIQAGAQFSVAEAKAGDSVTLTAGPVNVGDGASGAISNTVVLSSGLTATAYDDASWNAGTRTLSWTTNSLPSEGSDPKNFTVRVEDAGELTATASSNGAEGVASMVRTFPEDVIITPENSDSTCKLSGQPTVQAAPTPPAGVTLAFANTVGFTVIDCDRNPNASYPETLSVTIDVGEAIDSDARLYKISDAGQWSIVAGAVISGQTVTYSLTDDGDLDQDKTPGTLRDPVAIAYTGDDAPELKPVLPVPIPLWLLAALMGSVGWLGYRRLRLA